MEKSICDFTREEAVEYLTKEATRNNCKIENVEHYVDLMWAFEITSGIDYIMDMGSRPRDSVRYIYKNITDYPLVEKFKENELQNKKLHIISKAMKLRMYEKIVNKRTTWESLENDIAATESLVAATLAD